MSATSEFGSERFDELPFLVVDYDRVLTDTALANRMGNVNMALAISRNAVGISPLEIHGRLNPVVNDLIGVFTLTSYHQLLRVIASHDHS